ncbi:hypothetical protein KKB55_13870, partial [Myxococcota bacterium]|nr:hypothetical protein [Myxococcota bacterium]
MISLLLLAALAAPHPLNEAWQPPIKRWQARGVSVHGRLATIGVYYNDADFDEAPRYLDPSGPSVGQIATFFRPGVTLTPQEGTQIYYQAELGWSVWSQRDAEAEGLDAYHREIWAQQRLDDWGALRVGYQRIEDPSGLFLNHRAGAARLTYTYQGGELALLGGVTPDDTAEGLGEDNFEHDSAVGGLALQHTAGGLLLDLAGYGLWDHHIVDRPLTLGVLVLGLRRADGALWAHAVLQRGEWAGAALGGGAQRLA